MADLDVVVATQLAAAYLGSEVRQRLTAAGFGDVRESHGYLLQHLLAGPVSVTELARRLGISQQAVSKSATDLETAGYAVRAQVPGDRRSRTLALTARGRRMISSTRRIRAELGAELVAELGVAEVETCRQTLQAVLEHLGGGPAVRRRSVPVPP